MIQKLKRFILPDSGFEPLLRNRDILLLSSVFDRSPRAAESIAAWQISSDSRTRRESNIHRLAGNAKFPNRFDKHGLHPELGFLKTTGRNMQILFNCKCDCKTLVIISIHTMTGKG